MISILDYGAGNLRSVQNTLDEIGAGYNLVRDAEGLRQAEKILLPGVGHFGQMMRALDSLGVRETLRERISAGVPFFGICLGMHALFGTSEEAPGVEGLQLYPGRVLRFSREARVPHMGWNQLTLNSPTIDSDIKDQRASRLLSGLPENPYVYFAHSYYVPETSITSATCTYTLPYTAAVERGNVFGVQFHPEKSGPVGLAIVRNFVKL